MKKIHIDETLFEETPIEDLQQLARALLEDPKTGPVIRRSGVHGDFTQEEELAIKALIETHGKTQGWGVRDPVLLPLSVTLARQVADGVIESTDCIIESIDSSKANLSVLFSFLSLDKLDFLIKPYI